MEKSSIIENKKEAEQIGQMDRQLEEIQRIAGKLQEWIADARTMRGIHERNLSGFPVARFADNMQNASFCAERLTEKLRSVVLENCCGSLERKKYWGSITKLYGITVEYEDGIVRATLPGLMPHRKSQYTDYLYKPFYMALQEWCRRQQEQEKEVPVFQNATVCFYHLYDEALSAARVRDHDNIEEKQMLDAIGTFFLVSDGGLYLDTYHTSMQGNADRTYLFLMEQERFAEWIGGFHKELLVSKKLPISETTISTG